VIDSVVDAGFLVERFDQVVIRAAPLELRGEWDLAARLYAGAYREALRQQNIPDAVAALRRQAINWWQQGLYDEAEELAGLSMEIAERNGLVQAAAWALNMVAAIHHSRHDLLGARTLYTQAHSMALDSGDDQLVGLTCQNLGIIANILGNLREARALYLESIGSAVRIANAKNAMLAYNNLGMVCADLRDWMESEIYFTRGIEIADQLRDVPMRARLQANRAESLIHVGELASAEATLNEADCIVKEINALDLGADVARFRAMIARKQNDLVTAEQCIVDAIRLATEAGLALERAEALEELACIRAAEGRREEAFSTLNEAHERYEALGAKRDAARTLDVLENWSSRTSTAASTLPEVLP
jgi:tetratricopeptide (TPR) repeat protein